MSRDVLITSNNIWYSENFSKIFLTALALVFNKMIFEKEIVCKLVAKLFAHLCISESTIAKMIL